MEKRNIWYEEEEGLTIPVDSMRPEQSPNDTIDETSITLKSGLTALHGGQVG